jgi:hypothetical protein
VIEPTLEFQKPMQPALNVAKVTNGRDGISAGYVAADETLRNETMYQVKMFALVLGHAMFLALLVWLYGSRAEISTTVANSSAHGWHLNELTTQPDWNRQFDPADGAQRK